VAASCGYTACLALTATIYKFDIDLADADRHVYETLALQAARHPSESDAYFVARVLAYALEFTDGIAWSHGLAEPNEPAIAVRDLTGAMRVWIEIGSPDAARLHKASKAAPRVVVYTHKDPAQLVGRLAGEKIHRVAAIEVYAIDRNLIGALVARLDRRMAFGLSIADRELFISIGTETLNGTVVRYPLN
jgi:uncharacterized protein YaeQ